MLPQRKERIYLKEKSLCEVFLNGNIYISIILSKLKEFFPIKKIALALAHSHWMVMDSYMFRFVRQVRQESFAPRHWKALDGFKWWDEGTSEIPNTSRALFQVCFLYWCLNVLSNNKCSVDNMLADFYPLDRKLDIPGKKEYQLKDYIHPSDESVDMLLTDIEWPSQL